MAFQAPNFTTYYTDAQKKLNDYYTRILAEEQGDVERAKRRLVEDYQRGFRINNEDYERNISYGRESYGASLSEQEMENAAEKAALEGDLVSRGVSQGGLADKKNIMLKDKQALRREAIDRALRKSEEDLKYGKERGLEEETVKQKRGTEDVATNWAKFNIEKSQEREEKALGLADQAYNREFGKRSTEESFKMQQQGLNMQRESLKKM